MKIKFKEDREDAEILFGRPEPAKNFIPSWYKDMPLRTYEEKKDGISREGCTSNNYTLKGCVPFLDALTGGYMFYAPCDIEVGFDTDGRYFLRWLTDFNPVSSHSVAQTASLPRLSDRADFVFKWYSGWQITTPRGYSTLFTHPFNRNDLPFRTLTGIVDTDKHPVATHFPFQILDTDEKFIIEKGTPICQVIPFKRDSWESSFLGYDAKENKKNMNFMQSKISRVYRNNFWSKKTFK